MISSMLVRVFFVDYVMFQNYQEKVNNVGGDANDAEVVQDGVQDEGQVDGDE